MGKKAPPPPPPPDYMALAKQQADLSNAQLDKQTMENRVNQYTPEGSLTWSKDPTTGKWAQTTTYAPDVEAARQAQLKTQAQLSQAAQGMTDAAMRATQTPFSYEGMTNVSGLDPSQAQAWGQVPGQNLADWRNIDTSGLGDYGSIDFSKLGAMPDSGFGAVEQVRDAMMNRLQPGLTQGRDREVQRLKAQGITEGSPAWQAAMQSLNQRDVDASQQALLGAAGEYGNIFQRGMAARQQGASEQLTAAQYANALRQQQLGEQEGLANFQNNLRGSQFNEQSAQANYANTLRGMQMGEQGMLRDASVQDRNRQIEEALRLRQNPLNELNAFMSSGQVTGPSFGSYNTAGRGVGADVYGAGKDAYKAQMDAYNAAQAKKGGMMSGLMGLAGTVGGAYLGGMVGMPTLGAQLGGSLGGKLGGG